MARRAPAPAHRVPEWPAVSSEHGPYLRIDRQPVVRDNFLDEYYIAVKEGLDSGGDRASRATWVAMLLLLTLSAALQAA